jgi:hypothetical protein
MGSQGIGVPVPVSEGPSGVRPEELIRLERAITALSEQYLDAHNYQEFAAAQLSITMKLIKNAAPRSSDTNVNKRVNDFVKQSITLLGIDSSTIQLNDAELTTYMVAFTPSMRMQLLLSGKAADDGVVAEALMRVPYMLMGTHMIAAVARSVGMSVITLQSTMRWLRAFRPLLWLLTYADAVMMWKPSAKICLPLLSMSDWQLAFVRIAKALLRRRQGRSARTLAEVISKYGAFEDAERVWFLRLLGEFLMGRVMLPEEASSCQPGWRVKVPVALQQCVLDAAPEESVMHYLGRRYAGAGGW